MKLAHKILALLAGLALFGWYLSRADLKSVWEALSQLGWLVPLILLPYCFVYLVDCLGWQLSLPPNKAIRFWTLFPIRWAGEAVNNILPFAYVGGEAVKVYLLQKHGISAGISVPGAVVSKTAQTVAQVFYVILASIALLQITGGDSGTRISVLFVLATGVVLVAGLFWIQRRGLFGWLLFVAGALRIGTAFIKKRRTRILDADRAVTGFYRNHRARFCASTATYLIGWLSDTLEIFLVAKLLGMPIVWTQALAVEAFTSVAKILGMWIPGSLGVQDSGIVMLGRLTGLPDTLSISYALLRRARELIFAIIGWLILYGEGSSLGIIKAESSAAKQ